MRNSGLFKQFVQYMDETDFHKKQTLLEDTCEQYRRKHNAPDLADNYLIVSFLEKEYEKGLKRGRK